ncbi:MAG: hypothetical protein U0694_28790, partial [Anaerolineae bacterium]
LRKVLARPKPDTSRRNLPVGTPPTNIRLLLYPLRRIKVPLPHWWVCPPVHDTMQPQPCHTVYEAVVDRTTCLLPPSPHCA